MPPTMPPIKNPIIMKVIKPVRQDSRHFFARGFTLIELLVVIAIIVILASLTMSGLGVMQRKQATSRCQTQIGTLSNSLEEYKMDFGKYPVAVGNGSNTLYKALYWDGVDPAATQKIYLPELDPASKKQKWSSNPVASALNTIKDPWGVDYNYRSGLTETGEVNSNCINPDFDIWSFGPDGQEGSNGDKKSADNITNWK
jgi:general secretion pathway protein G